MTKKIGKSVVIYAENKQQCDYCGRIDELRPYGKDGACICFDCGMKPENKTQTEKAFDSLSVGNGQVNDFLVTMDIWLLGVKV